MFVLYFFKYVSQNGERCLCNSGFLGQSCQLGLHDNNGAGQWWHVSQGNPYTPPRTASAGVYLSSTGAMYLFGGERNVYLIQNLVSNTISNLLYKF